MLSSVFLKTLRDQRASGLFWAIGVIATCAYVVFLYPVIAENTGLNEFIKNMPRQITALVGGTLDYSTATGFLNAQLFSIIAPLVLIVYAVIQGTAAIAGEEERGTLALLLANPLPRRTVALHKALALTVGAAAGASVFFLGLVGWATAAGVTLDVGAITDGCVMLGLIALFFGSLAFALGAATGRRGLSGGVTGALAVASYLLNAFIPLIDWLHPARFATPFYYYKGADPLTNGLAPAHVLALIVGSVVLIAASLVAFERRDLLK